MTRLITVIAFMLFAFVANAQQMQHPMLLPVDRQPLIFETHKGLFKFGVEIAATESERERGLMWRTNFPKDRAMLFVFDYARTVMMWMENTPSPLDMVFLDPDGKVVSVRENAVPFSRDIISSGGIAGFTVELLAGTAKTIGVRAGDRVKHQVICGECK